MGPVIEARGLTHKYPGGTTALRGVTVTIEAGERVAVTGTNGSGKSTLQHVFGGLVEPTAETVEYVGETADVEAVRDRLGVLLQDPDDYLFNTTVCEDIEYGPAQLGMSRQAAAQRVAHLAAELGLESLLDHPPFRLSGGEKQRAAVASVLAFEPAMLLLDEPFSAVDAGYRERILEPVTDRERTVVLFIPSMDAVPEIAGRILVVGRDGSTAADGPVRDVLTDTTLLRGNDLRLSVTVQLFEGILDADDAPLTVSEVRAHLPGQA